MKELYMRRALFIAVLVLTVASMGVGQEQSARGTHRTSVEEAIRKLDNERIQAQIHADATALDRIYAADFIGVGPSGTVRTKPQVILDFRSGDLKFQSITTDDVQNARLWKHGCGDWPLNNEWARQRQNCSP